MRIFVFWKIKIGFQECDPIVSGAAVKVPGQKLILHCKRYRMTNIHFWEIDIGVSCQKYPDINSFYTVTDTEMRIFVFWKINIYFPIVSGMWPNCTRKETHFTVQLILK